MEVIRNLEKEHHSPADRAGVCDAMYSELRDKDECEHHSEGCLDERGDQRHLHIPHTAEEPLYAVGQCRQEIEEAHRGEICMPLLYHSYSLRPTDEERHEMTVEKEYNRSNQGKVAELQQESFPESFSHSIHIPSAPVLRAERGYRMADALLWGECEVIDARNCIVCRDNCNAECIDRALDQELANRLACLLQRCYRSVLQSCFQQRSVDADIIDAEHRHLPSDVDKAENRGN